MTILIVLAKETERDAVREMLSAARPDAELLTFDNGLTALAAARKQEADIALIDTELPELGGLDFGQYLRELYPDVNLIYLSTDEEAGYAALRQHASGILPKPVAKTELDRELEDLRYPKRLKEQKRLFAQTFGNFEIFVDGETLVFHRAKAKELLAYLIDRAGRGVNRPGIFAALWEEGLYDYSKQKYLDVIIRSLRETLKEAGIEEILEMKNGFLRIRPELVNCDLYRFLKNDPEAVNAYRGEYLEEYPWAVFNTDALSS